LHTTAVHSDLADSVAHQGFAIRHNVLSDDEAGELIAALDSAGAREGIQRRGGIVAVRNLLETVPEVSELAQAPILRSIAESVLGPECFAVRGTLFDKTPQTNWKVSWHQDLTIAVKQRVDVAGFGPWSEKAGVASVQPPVEVLESMVTIRVNLDDCGEDNGPLRVLPGSHAHGRLGAPEIVEWRDRVPEVLTVAPRGAALIMRPLLLHASSAATSPRHRRIIHLDYAVAELPGGLDWHVRA